ncbi:nuclear pore complex protein Nup75 [Drosophila tropicalis]|uniref:nuclear pore complex protein Nup75 n=1 Tax=Drosophila tropicalis TaxID=46794 RepID=UPI0035AB7C75
MEDDIPAFELEDKLAMRCGNTLTGVFVPGSKIALSAFHPVKWNSQDAPTDSAGRDPVLIYMAEEASLSDEPLLRSLLAEANSTFATLQQMGHMKAVNSEYLKISLTYRSIIRAFLEKVELAKKSIDVQPSQIKRYNEAIMVFYAVECLWHLFEILYMEPQQHNQLVVQKLLQWARFHFPQTEDRATDLLLMADEASDCDDYWLILRTLLMFGEVDVTRAILCQSRKAREPVYQAAELILKSMPVYQEGYALQKFLSQWEFWHLDLERKLQANIFASEPELEWLLQLVRGNNEQWNAGIKTSQDWYEFLPGYLLYTKPACKPFELRIVATSWLNRWSQLKPEWQMSNMSRMVMQLMEHDIKVFIYDSQKLNDTHWFSTHLIDLVYQSGHLKSYFEQNSLDLPSLRHSMIYEYGSYLMTSKNLWQFGVDYLDCCHEEGKAAIELLLPRIPVKTERQAFKIIFLARQRGLLGVEQEICKVLSKRSTQEGRHGNALEWAIRSKDVILVTAIADFILQHYSNTGTMLCPDVLASFGARMFISPRLVFLAKYYEFYELYRKREFLSAADLLVNLLDSKITPDYFWPSLLIDAVPMLESKDPKIFSQETVAILRHLETELVPLIERNKRKTATFSNQSSKTVFKDFRVENIEEILNLMRLACARNLSRALIIEKTLSL